MREEICRPPDVATRLVRWEDLLAKGRFRVPRPHTGPNEKRQANAEEKLAQQQEYARYIGWATRCGLDEAESRFLRLLEVLPGRQKDWGRQGGIPAVLQEH